LTANAPVGAFIVDERGVYQMVNDAFCTMLGYMRADTLLR